MFKWFMKFFGTTAEERAITEKPAKAVEDQLEGKLVIIKAGFDDSGDGEARIRVEVDYDDVFVKSLRARGYTGTDDHNIVMRYVADVHRSILQNNNLGFD